MIGILFLVAIIAVAVICALPQSQLRKHGCGRCPRYGEGCKTCARMTGQAR